MPTLTLRPPCFRPFCSALVFAVAALLLAVPAFAASPSLGLFSDHTDIGNVKHPGAVVYDSEKDAYTISGSGANMWLARDDFHYVWKKMSGDVSLAATVDFVGNGTEPHRKGCLMIRQSLDADSTYVDVVVHADGLSSLQFRDEKGGVTREVQTTVTNPRRLRIDKIGESVYMSLSDSEGRLATTGCSVRLPFNGEFYLGLGVCAHNANQVETVRFSQVEITAPSNEVTAVRSIIETIPIGSRDRRAVYHTKDLVEAPNWSHDGSALYYNGGGRIHRLALEGEPKPELIDTGTHIRCNNDHGISPDGKFLAISDSSKDGKSRIYVLPITGGTPKEITPNAPSYWHGWSPDGTMLAYCAQRDGKFGIFTIPAIGGDEKRITLSDGLDDGPDYSPDGKWIYFNSDRTGRMQIWRMHTDGTEQEQVTNDGLNDWFPHPSPDGKWIVFLPYAADVKGHPRDKDVMLRMIPAGGGEITTLAKLFGGQGTINVPSWSPDSTKVAYVRYQPVEASAAEER